MWLLVHISDLVVRAKGLEVVVSVDVVYAGDKLLCKLEYLSA
jgi:hypothetical protein